MTMIIGNKSKWKPTLCKFWNRWGKKSKLEWILSVILGGSDCSIEMFIDHQMENNKRTRTESYDLWTLITRCRCERHLDYWIGVNDSSPKE